MPRDVTEERRPNLGPLRHNVQTDAPVAYSDPEARGAVPEVYCIALVLLCLRVSPRE